jgi:hypothetical protein
VARLREIRREFERGLVGTRGPKSYLDTLTLVDPPKFTLVAESLRPRGAADAPKIPGEPAPSEVFLTAQPAWHSPAGGTDSSSLSPAGVPRPNRAIVVSGALGIAAAVAVAVVVLAVVVRAPPASDGPAHEAPPASGRASTPDSATSRAVVIGVDPGPPVAPPSASPAASALATPLPREPRADGRATRRTERTTIDAGSPPGQPAAVTTGITTQKDWF